MKAPFAVPSPPAACSPASFVVPSASLSPLSCGEASCADGTAPFFSIIMASKAPGPLLERALTSLCEQTCPLWECLVQDCPLELDAGVDVAPLVERVARRGDARVRALSCPDTGVYDAWNKALDRARGTWLLFLGTDDALVGTHILSQARRALLTLSEAVLFAQAGLHVVRRGKLMHVIGRSKAQIFAHVVMDMPLLTPALFMRRTLFDTARFDASYSIAGDFAFVAERLTPANVALLPFVLSIMEYGGLSSAVKTRALRDAERKRVLETCVLPRAHDVVQACIDTFMDSGDPLSA